jgi:thiamine pyrophosphate-dependent acetolactate synthase large subunit-like protein
MSQLVAELLVNVLEQIRVKPIFGHIGDSLNPLGDAVRRSKIAGLACATRKARRRPLREWCRIAA